MRISTLLVVPVVAALPATVEEEHVFEKRQGYIGMLNMAAPAMALIASVPKVAGIVPQPPTIQGTGITHTITKLGPVRLKGNNNGREQNFFWNVKDGICKNCSILKGKVGVEFANGSRADVSHGVFMHHVLSWDVNKKPPAFISNCKSSSPYSAGQSAKFLGTGDDQAGVDVWYSTKDGKTGGFHVGPSDSFPFWVDLVNYNKEDVDVVVTIDLEYRQGLVGVNTRDALLSVDACGTRIRTSNAGPVDSKAGDWTFLEDGVIVYTKGHLHNGGDRMVLYINGKEVCQSVATYGGETGSFHAHGGGGFESISGMSTCGNIPVRKGDRLSMTTIYDVKKHPMRQETGLMGAVGLMGMFTIVFTGAR